MAEADPRQPLVAPSRELLRLHGEIGVLRQQNHELSRLLAQRAVPAEAEGVQPSTAWADSGTATPEAAANTFAWAAMTGNTNRLADVLIVPEEVGINIDEFMGAMSLILHPAIAKIKGSRLVFTETSTHGEVTYLFQNQLADGNTEMSPLTVKQVDGNWKVKLPFVADKKPERLEGPQPISCSFGASLQRQLRHSRIPGRVGIGPPQEGLPGNAEES